MCNVREGQETKCKMRYGRKSQVSPDKEGQLNLSRRTSIEYCKARIKRKEKICEEDNLYGVLRKDYERNRMRQVQVGPKVVGGQD